MVDDVTLGLLWSSVSLEETIFSKRERSNNETNKWGKFK